MSFDADVIFEGLEKNPTPLRGGSGAQSSIVPALLAGLGIEHASTELTTSLMDMRQYMPVEHRAFIQRMRQLELRSYCESRPHLADAYNHVLRQLITFRRAHLYYARTYIFEKSTDPTGTGGTAYMAFLSKLIDETTDYFL
jgi:indoleamine 2,3-dioxygenase